METTEHFFLECHIYEVKRLVLFHNLHTQLGMNTFDLCDLLSYEEKKDFPEWRDTVILNVCTFIEKSGRFNSTVTTNSDTRTH